MESYVLEKDNSKLLVNFPALKNTILSEVVPIKEIKRYVYIECFDECYRTSTAHTFSLANKFVEIYKRVCWYRVTDNSVEKIRRAPKERGEVRCRLSLELLPEATVVWTYSHAKSTHEKINVYQKMKAALESIGVSTEGLESLLN